MAASSKCSSSPASVKNRHRLTGIAARFAIVTPNNDAPLSLHHVVPGIQHTVIKGTGHWIHLDKPAEFNLVLDIFLRGL